MFFSTLPYFIIFKNVKGWVFNVLVVQYLNRLATETCNQTKMVIDINYIYLFLNIIKLVDGF